MKKRNYLNLKDKSKTIVFIQNPIRRVTDSLSVPANPSKAPIRLNLGDPTLTGCLLPSDATVAALRDAVDSHRFDGYGPAVGTQAAREAVAEVLFKKQIWTIKHFKMNYFNFNVRNCSTSQPPRLKFRLTMLYWPAAVRTRWKW